MKKTMHIPAGTQYRYESLVCDNLVVNGHLKVDGGIRARHISGEGFIQAHSISAKSISICSVDASVIVADRLLAEQVTAVEVRAVESAAIASYIEADLVKAGKITLSDSCISDLVADEVIHLKKGGRSLLGTLFASFIRSRWTALFHRAPKDAEHQASTSQEAVSEEKTEHAGPSASPDELAEVQALLQDTEFHRLRMMYQLTKETDCLWQLIPKAAPTERAVHYVSPQFAAVDNDGDEVAA